MQAKVKCRILAVIIYKRQKQIKINVGRLGSCSNRLPQRRAGIAPNHFNEPPIGSILSSSETASIKCTETSCELRASSKFLGVILAVSSGTVTASESQNLKTLSNGRCLTHNKRLNVDKIDFTVTTDSTSVVRAVVVFRRNNNQHVFAKADTIVQKANQKAYVIGAGPGGLGAAKALAALGVEVIVYERGPATTVDFDGPIMNTYQDNAGINVLKIKDQSLGQGPGGTQSINGAVYAPGSAEDLAKSVGVNINDAKLAQQQAADMVPHTTNPPMMWECIDENDCDEATFASSNFKMKRRSIAFEGLDMFTIVSGCNVTFVGDDQITVKEPSGNCKDVSIDRNTIVIVAAGALVSPEYRWSCENTHWLEPLLSMSQYHRMTFQRNKRLIP